MVAPHDGAPDDPIDSTQGVPESNADRERVAKRLAGGAAAVLILEALAVLFVPRAIAQSGPGLTTFRLSAVVTVVVLLIVVAGLQRRSWGSRAGLVVQLPVLATGLFTAAMWFLGGLFLLLWIYLMRIRHELLGSPPMKPSNGGG
ncbi:MAG: DUF4233 domain-containing protein [Geodermatophilaceae bacterium]|nr:DUF4233 domain-containing protein [Geodermatophilaceae bacterium]